MLVPFWDLLASQIGMAAIWGLSAGLLTVWLWSQRLRFVAFAVGFWGYVCAYVTTLYLMNISYQRFFPYSSFGKTQSQWPLIFTALGAGILAQILVLCLLLGLRRLTRYSRQGENSLRP